MKNNNRIKIIALLIGMVMLNLSCSIDTYTNYYNGNVSIEYAKNYYYYTDLPNNATVEFRYLGDHDGYKAHTYIPKNIRGQLVSQITIKKDDTSSIEILECHLVICDETMRIIPFHTMEIYYHFRIEEDTKSYNNENEFINSKPVMIKEDYFEYRIYYTYSYGDFKNIKKGYYKVKLKLLINDKEYIIKKELKLQRKEETGLFFWIFGN